MKRSRQIAAVLLCVLVVNLVVPPSPAAGYNGTDLAYTPPTGWSASGSWAGASTTQVIRDGDDSSFAETGLNGGEGCSSQTVHSVTKWTCAGGITYARTSGVATFDLYSFRVKATFCTSGWPTYASCGAGYDLYAIRVSASTSGLGTCGYTTGTELYYSTLSEVASIDTGQINFGSVVTIDAVNVRQICVVIQFEQTSGIGGGGLFYTLSNFDDDNTLPTDFDEYIYGLRLDHPPFQRLISFWWAQTWDGVWSVTDEDDDVLNGGLSGGSQGEPVYTTIQCTPVCGHDTYTVHVHPDGHDEATYEIDSDADGYLTPYAGSMVISYLAGCYNVGANDCPDPLDAAADSAGFSFTLTPSLSGRRNDGTVSFGRYDTTQDGCEFVGSPVTTGVITAAGNYTQIVASWDQSAGYFSVDGDQLWLVRWDSSIDGYSHTCKVLAVNVTASEVTIRETPVDTVTPCEDGLEGLACNFGTALREALNAGEEIWHDAVSEAVSRIHDAAMEKLPFAYVVLAVDSITGVLADADLEVESSNNCAGVVLTVPLYYGGSNLSASPSPWPVTVLSCASLEPTMGSSWYQAIRTAMDPALWVLFGWTQFKRLQPKPSLNG